MPDNLGFGGGTSEDVDEGPAAASARDLLEFERHLATGALAGTRARRSANRPICVIAMSVQMIVAIQLFAAAKKSLTARAA